jgi:hypothetical protein
MLQGPTGSAASSTKEAKMCADFTPPPTTKPQPNPGLLDSFRAKFPKAAALIDACPPALGLVNEAAALGVLFGGYAEEAPNEADRTRSAFTIGNTVYVPKLTPAVQTEIPIAPETAAAGFLFELTNGISQAKFTAIEDQARAGQISAEVYANETTKVEVLGSLRLAEIWVALKGGKKELDKYDDEYNLDAYLMFKKGEATLDQLVEIGLETPYPYGDQIGRTPRQYYSEQYDKIRNQ